MDFNLHTPILSFGNSFDELFKLAHRLDVEDRVTFTSRADLKMIGESLSSLPISGCPLT